MFIAFEGPDKTGKSTSARMLTFNGEAVYNATKDNYEGAKRELAAEPDLVQCWDRIDWFSHMVYRLALPDHEWNDERPRTVFAMPDTHLVVKLHHPQLAERISDELYTTGTLGSVNEMYYYQADFLTALNRARDYSLFRTISMVEVINDPSDGSFSQRLVAFDSPATSMEEVANPIDSDADLLEFLRRDEQHRI